MRCTLISIKNKGMDHRNGDYVYGKGYGKTEQDAIKAAKHDINKNYVPDGTQAKHCKTEYTSLQKFLIQFENIFADYEDGQCINIMK